MNWRSLCAVLNHPCEEETPIRGVSTDTRTLQPGDVFVALTGDRFDGARFLDDAARAGAVGCVISDRVDYSGPMSVIRVPDTQRAYADIARAHRRAWGKTVIGITGSVGKTTMRHFVGQLLAPSVAIHQTHHNNNNAIGVPKTLLGITEDRDVAVVEMGARHLNDIAVLADIAEPTIGILTRCAPCHLETFGSLENILREKSALLAALPREVGWPIIDGHQPDLTPMKRALKGQKTLFYGTHWADIRAESIRLGPDGSAFEAVTPWGRASCQLPIPGAHMIDTRLAR
jgi:UDP-N-acetylmuramyl pentapeptide synthase